MKTVFADTGYWMALLNTSDAIHQKAINLTTTLMPFNLTTVNQVSLSSLKPKQVIGILPVTS